MKTFYKTIEQLKKEGYPTNQAVAIAYSHLRKQCGVPKDYKPGKMTPSEIVAYGGGKKEELYPGVIVGDSLYLFYSKATKEEIEEFEEFIKSGKLEMALKLMEQVLGDKYPKFIRSRLIGFLEKLFAYPTYVLKEQLKALLNKLSKV